MPALTPEQVRIQILESEVKIYRKIQQDHHAEIVKLTNERDRLLATIEEMESDTSGDGRFT